MSKPIIQGAGKGGSQRNPVDHPNTLQARSTAKLIDLISEGPIFGLVKQDALEQSIFMDDTPVANTDGSLNYEGVRIFERKGDADQSVMPGFSQVETEISLNTPLTKQNPVLFTIQDSNVKQVRLKVRLNALYRQNQENGDVEPTSVKLMVELGSSGDSGASAVDDLPLTAGVASVSITAGGSGYTVAPTVSFSGGDGTGAAATATISGGAVTAIAVTNPGSGYTVPPTVAFSMPSGAFDEEAVATSTLEATGGSGYTSAPTVAFSGGSPTTAATALAEISGGKVTGLFLTTSVHDVNVTHGGSGYTGTATVTFSGGGGTGAAGTPVVVDGEITGVTITNSGSGYTSAPTVTFADTNQSLPYWWDVQKYASRKNNVPSPFATGVATGNLAGGSGYSSAPTVSLTGGGGSGATVIAKVSPYHIYGGEITISGKTVGAYEESYLIDLEDFSERLQEAGLSAASYPITVRVSRLTEDSEAATVQDTLQVSTYTEIQPYNLTYADSALVGLVVDAQKFGGNIPRRSFDVKGKLVRVPTGYLADVEFATPRTYPDFWDGTFETKWSNNPAWILLDILNNERYGLGLEDSDIDVYALYEISKYCDELVPIKTINSEGVTEEDEEYRYTCNAVINSRREAYQVLQAIASTFRGMVYASANGVGFSQDRPKDPARLVSPADVIDGSFTYSSTARKARHSCALITWNDPDDNYKQAVEVYEDLDLIDRYGYNPIEVVAYGTTSQTQARRLGKWILDSEKNETDTITFQGGLDFLDISPGEIIAVADPMKQNARLGGRIMSHDFLTLTPSATADETIASAGTIAHGDMTLTSDAVFECVIKLDENIQPTGCIWEVGNSTTGAYLGFNDDGDLVARAGYGGSDLSGNANELARLVIQNSKLPTGRNLKLLVGIEVGTASTAGRVRVWQNSQFLGEATTGDGSSLSSGWSAASDGKYGGASGASNIVLGETGDYDENTNVALVSSLSYWAASNAKVRHLLQTFTINDEVQSGAAVTSLASSSYSSAANSVQHDTGATFECSIQMPSSGTPTGLVYELGNGSTASDEGMYVGFDSAGDLRFHVGSGGSTPDDTDSCQVVIPASYFSNGESYHLMWACDPVTGRLGAWLNWEYFSTTLTSDSSGLANSRFADTENGGYGLLSSNTLTDQVTTVFNGTFLTPLRYYNEASQTSGTTTLLSVDNATDYGSITLDADYSTQPGDRVMFMTNEMRIDNLSIRSGTSGTEITLQEYPTGEPVTNAMYVIQAAAANAKEYRVLSTREVEPARYEVTALEYDQTKFARVEQDLIVDRPSTDLFPKGAITPPTNLTFRESLYRTSGDVLTRIDLSCTASTDPRVSLYEWEVRHRASLTDDALSWEPLSSTPSTTASVLNAEPGWWDFRVTATGGGTKGTTSPAAELLSQRVYGKQLPPANVQNLTAQRGFSSIRLSWDAVSDLDIKDYAVVQGSEWGSSDPTYINATDLTVDVETTDSISFLVRARDTSNNLSTQAASVTVSVKSLTAVTNLVAHSVYVEQSLYSATARLTWTPLGISSEVISYEVRATSDSETWDNIATVGRETTDPEVLYPVVLEDGTSDTFEFKVRPFVELSNGSRSYGPESSVSRLMYPGNGTSHKIQNEHSTWSSLPTNEAQSFIENGVAEDQSTPKDTQINAAFGAGWVPSESSPEFDRRASGVWSVKIQVSDWAWNRGCLFEMGNASSGCYLGFDGSGDLIWRAGSNNSTPTNYARTTISNSTLSAAISTAEDFTIVCEVRNDGVNSGRARLWVVHDGGVITASTGETSDASSFTDQTWATNKDGYINGYYDSIVTGESAGFSAIPTNNAVTYSSEVKYWHDLLVQAPLEVSGGNLVLTEGSTFGKYVYDFNLSSSLTGEMNFKIKASSIAATRLKVFETFNRSVYSYIGIPITPSFLPSATSPAWSMFIDPGATGTFYSFVPATQYSFEDSKIKLELRRDATSEYRPSVSFLQTTLSN